MNKKLTVLIIDDDFSDIGVIKEMLQYTGYFAYMNVHDVRYIEQNDNNEENGTLKQFINQNKECIDIALIDFLFPGYEKTVEYGGEQAARMVRERFPFCEIIFCTRHGDKVSDGKIFSKFNASPWAKSNMEDGKRIGKLRMQDAIKEWVKSKLFEISANETAKKECFQAIQGDTIEWDSQITIGTERWTFENLFFIYKNQPKEKINELFKKYLVRFPKIKPRESVNRWEEATGLYKSPLKDYYFLLYGSYYAELTNITNKAKLFLDNLFEFLLTYLKTIDNNDEKKENESLTQIKNNILERAESICNIREKVPIISENPYIALQQFTKKLISRLISITSYVLFDMSVPSILYLFTKNDFQSTNNAKLISHFLFIFEMRYDEQQSDFESFIYEFSEPKGKTFKVYKPIDRKYTTILGTMEEAGSCSDYELDFISSYFKEIKDRVQKENNDIINAYFNETFNVLNGSEVLKNRNNS